MTPQKVDLRAPIVSSVIGPPPIVVNVHVTPQADHVVGGVPASSTRLESYVLFSALPEELQQRVKSAVQVLISAM